MTTHHRYKLSICIPTFNRADFIGATLDSIISQLTSACEIVVSDNASTDDTHTIVAEQAGRCDRLRYIRQVTNVGCDRNFDSAVKAAEGEYCWLFSDDDVMKQGALAAVLGSLSQGYSLVLVNAEHRDFTMSDVRIRNFFGVHEDRVYHCDDFDRLFMDVGRCAMCACCIVIRRDLWCSRERERYYGSWFIHTAVLFQKPIPGTTLVIAKPLMSLRLGNRQTAQKDAFFVWYISWPSLLWSFPLDSVTKLTLPGPTPWKRFSYLLALRAAGRYSLPECNRWLLPRLSGLREALIPILVGSLSPDAASLAYRISSRILGWPRSPYDPDWTMFPASSKELRSDTGSIHE